MCHKARRITTALNYRRLLSDCGLFFINIRGSFSKPNVLGRVVVMDELSYMSVLLFLVSSSQVAVKYSAESFTCNF